MTAISTEAGVGRQARGYWAALRAEIAKDRLFYAIVAGYGLLTAVVAYGVGAPEKLVYLDYVSAWLKALFALSVTAYLLFEVVPSVLADRANPLARARSRLAERFNPRFAAGLVLLLSITLFEGTFTSAKNLLADMTAFRWDGAFAAADAFLSGGEDPWLRLQPLLGHHAVTRVLQVFYLSGWLVFLCGITGAVAISRRLAHLRLRYFLTYAFCWIVLGNLLAGVFMSAGPAYYGEVTGDVARFAPQLHYLAFSQGMQYSSYDLQLALWDIYRAGQAELGSGISAFPSLHVATAMLFCLTGWSVNRWCGLIGTAFLAIIAASSVHLGWHYAVDGYASMALTAAAWFGFGALERRTVIIAKA